VNQEAPTYVPRGKRIAGDRECRAAQISAKATSTPKFWTSDVELPGVIEDGMPGKNGQRKLGTPRGSPRRSRTAKASPISRHAMKWWCAREGGGWGRVSDDGSGQNNPDSSEGPWGGGLPTLHGGVLSSRLIRHRTDRLIDPEVHEGRTQTDYPAVYVGSRLKLRDIREGPV